MASPALNRIVTLEQAMASLAAQVERTSATADRTSLELREFKTEMSDFKDEMRAARHDLNKRLGEIANKQGRLVEDIVAPSVEARLREVLRLPDDAEVEPFGIRLKLKVPGAAPSERREVDVLAGHGDVGLVVEVKSTLSPEGVAAFAERLPELRPYVAPFGVRELIGGVATLYPDPSIVALGTRLGLVVLGVGDDLMDVKNPPGFAPKRF